MKNNLSKVKSPLKTILIFLITFFFIQLCGIYIMGGFEHQTIQSKLVSVLIGIVFGLAMVGFFNEDEQ
jgi:hypothetical protein